MSKTEYVVAAAIKIGEVICSVPKPGRHCDVFYAMHRAGFDERCGPESQGFLTDLGRFVDRVEGKAIATAAGQLIPRAMNLRELFSEDVW